MKMKKKIILSASLAALGLCVLGCGIALAADLTPRYFGEENLRVEFNDDKLLYEVMFEGKWYTISAKHATLVYAPLDDDGYGNIAVFAVKDIKLFNYEEIKLSELYINVCYMPQEE